jgi:hypothetical protein
MHDINYDSRFFIFNKIIYKEPLIKIFDENIEKIATSFLSTASISNLFANYVIEPININNAIYDNKFFEKYGFSTSELRKLNETLLDSFESAKNAYKTYKLNLKLCEKIRDNYSSQYNSLDCIYKNVSSLYE